MENLHGGIIVLVLSITAIVSTSQHVDAQRRHKKVVVKRSVVRNPHRTVVVRKAHIRYSHLPRWGTAIHAVPEKAVVIRTRNTPFYFHEGIYYTKRNTGYVVSHPSIGIRIKSLPVGHRRIIVGPNNYYYYYGTFYSKTINTSEEYEVVEAPEGAIVDALPDGYEVKSINGTEYYVLDEVYYGEVDEPAFDDGVGYQVVKSS